jgi:hypothetical protein
MSGAKVIVIGDVLGAGNGLSPISSEVQVEADAEEDEGVTILLHSSFS